MSTAKEDKTKIVLPRTGPELFWEKILDNYAGDDPLRWRWLAMFALSDVCHWPVDRIAKTFEIAKGHVTRSINRVKDDLRDNFDLPDDFDIEETDK